MRMIRKIKNFGHAIEAELASLIYARGRKKIPTIGVTGTDGKTTTSSLIFHILRTAGFNPAVITTVGAQIGDKTYETGLHTTTPSAFTLQRYIKLAVDSNCDYLILEITSHALDQNRIGRTDFKIGVLTNITHEHLDYHGTYEKYAAVKSRLFKKSDVSILNRDDSSYELLASKLSNQRVYTYSVKNKADFNTKSIDIDFPSEYDFNYENFLAAISVAKILGVPKDKIHLAINTFKFPAGRQEILYDKSFRAIVDFAHTPNSFAKVLPAIKKSTKGKLIHVFGSAGKRDASKRPMMGKISSENSDIIILTAEDPRSEKIADINIQIKLGITNFTELDYRDYEGPKNEKNLFEIPDRNDAINFAIEMAQPGDTVIATGKGHEQSINYGHGEVPWSDQEAFNKAIEKKLKEE